LEDTIAILPVCCRCHKVRVGEEWSDNKELLESYKENITHGLCPECAVILYPKYAHKIVDAYCIQ